MDKSLRVVIQFWARPENRAEEPIAGALCAAMVQAFAEIAGLREANQHLRNELAAMRKEA